MFKVKILGSGGWEAIPAPFCNCEVCTVAQSNTKSKNNRTRPEILIETEDGKFLIEISPDIRVQSTKFKLPKIKDFLVSHWHFDHMYGLLELHAWAKFSMNNGINIYCSERTKEWLDKNFAHIPKNVNIIKQFQGFKVCGVNITALPVYHMHSSDADIVETELENTFGFMLEKDNKKIVYLPDYFKLPKRTTELIKKADVVIMDGTYLYESKFPNKPEQNGEKSDPDHLHDKQITDLAKSLDAKKIVFHSITHLTEKTHNELQKLLPKTMYVSYDGMTL